VDNLRLALLFYQLSGSAKVKKQSYERIQRGVGGRRPCGWPVPLPSADTSTKGHSCTVQSLSRAQRRRRPPIHDRSPMTGSFASFDTYRK